MRKELKFAKYGECTAICDHSNEDTLEYIHAYDLVRIANNWIETEEGVLVPKNGILITTSDDHAVEKAKFFKFTIPLDLRGRIPKEQLEFYDMSDVTLIKPYRTFYSCRSKVREHLEKFSRKELEVPFASDPKSTYVAGVYDDTVLYAPGIDAIAFTPLRPEYQQKEQQIMDFMRRMFQK